MIRPRANRPLAAGLVLISLLSCAAVAIAEDPREHALFQAIRRGDVVLFKDLLRRGTPPDIRAGDNTTPLMQAALHGSAEMVELLLKQGADPRAANDRGVTALLWGARDEAKVKLLLAAGADPNARSALGNTPLMAAAASPAGAKSVEQLLASGADLAPRNKGGRSALYLACTAGNVETVQMLLAKAKELNRLHEIVSEAGSTVAVAATDGFHDIVKLLLDHGADPNRVTGGRGHGLNMALLAGHNDIAKTLIERGVSLKVRTNPGEVPSAVLAAYTEVGDASIVEMLKAHQVDFAAANAEGETALTWARMRGDRKLIDTLVKAGAKEGNLPEKPEMPARAVELHAGSQTKLIATAVQKSVDLLQLSSDTFLDVRNNCVSCHHQNLPGVALGWARDRGFAVRTSTLERMNERQVLSWQSRIDRAYEMDTPFPVPPSFLGYGLWQFAELGYRPDELTRTVVWYLAATQQPDGRWVPGMLRPPLGGDKVQATALALRSLQLYPLSGHEEETAEQIARARAWLEQVDPPTHEEQIYRMLGLAWAGVEAEALANEVAVLLDRQRSDGGWAQLPGLESDAWATGQALVALHTAGGLPTDHPAYRRGIEMLLKTQFDDGSWFVQSRTWPFQPYFESKFPYGRDQWVSAPATAWSVMALVLAVKPEEVARLNIAGKHQPADDQAQHLPAEPSRRALPAPATRQVDFARDIRPLIARSCLGCHGDKEPESSFSMTSRGALIRGGDSELPAIVPGASDESQLVFFAAGQVAKMEMPPLDSRDKYPGLTDAEISLLRAWIDQGAEWTP